MSPIWTAERLAIIVAGVAAGKTYAAIAKEIDPTLTKSAVSGIIWRMRQRHLKRSKKTVSAPLAKMRVRARPKGIAAPKRIIDLDATDCHWPIGRSGPNSTIFCAAEVVDGRSYCHDHCCAAYPRYAALELATLA